MKTFNIKDFIKQYEEVFNKFNEKYFENELPTVVLTVNSDTTKGAYGWCTSGKVWKHEDDEDGFYEIVLTAEHINRAPEEVAGTVLHEMIHLYNLQHEIADTSGNGYYHNKKFKEAAEKFGLKVEKTDYGWSQTTLSEEQIEFVKTLNLIKFDFHRLKKGKVSKPNKGKKYQCPVCGSSFWSSKEMHVHCEDCDEDFEIVN